jgi:SPOR domain
MHHGKGKFTHLMAAAAIVYTFCPIAEIYGQTVSDRVLSDVTAQKVGDCATMTIRFHGRVQLLSFFPQTSGRELNIRLRPLDNTGVLGRESLRAPTGVPALRSIEFEGDNASGPTLSLFFKRDVRFDVAAGSDPETIIVSVSEAGSAAICEPVIANAEVWTPLPTATVAIPATEVAEAKPDAVRPDVAVPAGLYVVNVLSQPNDIADLTPEKSAKLAGRLTYDTSFERDGLTWHRLRAGFFETRQAAEAARQELLAVFPDAWVVKVTAQERDQGVATRRKSATEGPAIASKPDTTGTVTATDQDAIKTILADAELAIKTGDNDHAVQLLTKGVSYPENDLTPRMQELLGLTRERKSQRAQAKAEYEEYLRRYPTGEGADRVRQRLASLDAPASDATGTVLRAPTDSDRTKTSAWHWGARGSFSQFYFRDQSKSKFVTAPINPNDPNNDPVIDNAVNVNQLLSNADFTLSGGNDRTEYQIRAAGSYTKSFRAKTQLVDPITGAISFRSGDVKTLSALYFDAADSQTKISARIGRQTRNGAGVFGRFDGALIGWQAKSKIKLNIVGGAPVLRARDIFLRSDRYFYGASVDIGAKRDKLQSTLYWYDQRSPGLIDRQAVGAEVRYLKDRFNTYALIDYDVHFSKVNLALLTLNYSLKDESNISVTADYRQSPLLQSWNVLNGLFGQILPGGTTPITDLQDVQQSFTDAQLYGLAKDNTIVSKSLTVSYSRPITKKLQANIDFTLNNTGGSPGSTVLFPGSTFLPPTLATGTEYYYGAQLVGSGMVFENDIYILSGRYADTPRSRSYTADINARIPVTSKFRLSPRARYGYRTDKLVSGSYRQIQPSVRFNYYPMKRSEVEIEIGANFSTQKTSFGGIPSTNTERGILLSAGYRFDF